MKLTKRKIQAASDFRTFDGYDLDELQESYPEIYASYIDDISDDVSVVYLSRNPDCMYIGCRDSLGDYYVYDPINLEVGSGWFEVTFTELSNYLS